MICYISFKSMKLTSLYLPTGHLLYLPNNIIQQSSYPGDFVVLETKPRALYMLKMFSISKLISTVQMILLKVKKALILRMSI